MFAASYLSNATVSILFFNKPDSCCICKKFSFISSGVFDWSRSSIEQVSVWEEGVFGERRINEAASNLITELSHIWQKAAENYFNSRNFWGYKIKIRSSLSKEQEWVRRLMGEESEGERKKRSLREKNCLEVSSRLESNPTFLQRCSPALQIESRRCCSFSQNPRELFRYVMFPLKSSATHTPSHSS